MNPEDEPLTRTPTRVLRSGKRIAATPASARPAASNQESRRATKGATTSKKPQRSKAATERQAASLPQPRLSLADKLDKPRQGTSSSSRSPKTSPSGRSPARTSQQSFTITASPVAGKGVSPARAQQDRISFGAWVPPSPTAWPSPSAVQDAAVRDITMQGSSDQPADFAVYRSLDFSGTAQLGTAASLAQDARQPSPAADVQTMCSSGAAAGSSGQAAEHSSTDNTRSRGSELTAAVLAPAAAEHRPEHSQSMLSSASSDGALSIESRQGSEVLPSSAEAQPASDAPAASSQPGDSMLLDPDKTSETAEELTERSGDTEMDLVGEPVFTPAKARPDVDAASLIESLSLGWSGPMRASAALSPAAAAAAAQLPPPPSTQTTPAVKAAGLPGRFTCGPEGQTPQNTPALKAPVPGMLLNEQVLQAAVQDPFSLQEASSHGTASPDPGSPATVTCAPQHISVSTSADRQDPSAPAQATEADLIQPAAAAADSVESTAGLTTGDDESAGPAGQESGVHAQAVSMEAPAVEQAAPSAHPTQRGGKNEDPKSEVGKAVRVPQVQQHDSTPSGATAASAQRSTAPGHAVRAPEAVAGTGKAVQGPGNTGAGKAARVPQAAGEDELAALDRELAVIAAIKQEDSAFEGSQALSARSKPAAQAPAQRQDTARKQAPGQSTPQGKRANAPKAQSITPEGFVPRGRAGTPFLQRKLREQQAKDWEGKGKMKPHKSRLELAKEAAALCRDSDASKASVRRMVGLAFAKAITTEGKSLGESMTRHKSRLERDKEQAAAERKAQETASKAAASPALPRGDWTPEGLDTTLASLPKHLSRLEKEQQAAAATRQPHRGPDKDGSTAAPRPSLGSSMVKHKSRLEHAKEAVAGKEPSAVPRSHIRAKTGWESQPGLGAMQPHRSRLEKDKDAWSRCAKRQEDAKKVPSGARRPEAAASTTAPAHTSSRQPAKDQSMDSPSYLRPTRSSLRKVDPAPSQPFSYVPN